MTNDKARKTRNLSNIIFRLIFCAAVLTGNAPAQTEVEPFQLKQSVMAGGGGTLSAPNNFALEAAIGQPAAGTRMSGSSFFVSGGFWTIQLAPTAANVTLSGQIRSADGNGIKNAFLTLTKADGSTHTIFSGKLGHYRFAEIEAGQIVFIRVQAKRFIFVPDVRIINATENITDADFTAQP